MRCLARHLASGQNGDATAISRLADLQQQLLCGERRARELTEEVVALRRQQVTPAELGAHSLRIKRREIMTQHHHKHATLTHAGPGKPKTLSNAAVVSSDSDHDCKLAFLNDIRLSAYQKWEAAGKPAGDGVQFWLEAEQELVEGTKEKFVQGDGWHGDRELESREADSGAFEIAVRAPAGTRIEKTEKSPTRAASTVHRAVALRKTDDCAQTRAGARPREARQRARLQRSRQARTSSRPRTCFGNSRKSFSFSLGRMTRRMPARRAASTFSLTPPMGKTNPVRVISPVMAVSLRAGVCVYREASAVIMATPALGPSFGHGAGRNVDVQIPPCETASDQLPIARRATRRSSAPSWPTHA